MKDTQAKRTLRFMREHGSITPLQAIEAFGCTRLAAVIHTLRHEWHIGIDKEMIPVTNRYGETCHVARYRLTA